MNASAPLVPFALCAIALAALAGYGIAERHLRAAAAADEARENAALVRAREENLGLKEEVRRRSEPGGDATGPGSTYLPRLRALGDLVALLNEGMPAGRAVMPVLTVEGTAGDEIAALLGLTPQEEAALEAAASDAVAQAIPFVAPNVSIRRQGRQWIVTLNAFAYADRTREFHDRMRDRFMSILGPERYELFSQIGYVAAATRELANAGYGVSVIRVALTPQAQAGVYAVQETRVNLRGAERSEGFVAPLPEIRTRLGLLGAFIPSADEAGAPNRTP